MNARSFKLFVGAVLLQAFVAGSAQAAVNLGGSAGDLLSAPSGADPMYTFVFSIGPDSGNGTLTTLDNGGGSFWATGGTLNVTSGLAVGSYSLSPGGPGVFLSPGGAFFADNVVYPALDPTLDVDGLLFTLGSAQINIFGNGPGNYSFYEWTPDGSYVVADDQFADSTFALTAVPEPTIWAMLLIGFFGVGTMMRRSRGLQVFAAA